MSLPGGQYKSVLPSNNLPNTLNLYIFVKTLNIRNYGLISESECECVFYSTPFKAVLKYKRCFVLKK